MAMLGFLFLCFWLPSSSPCVAVTSYLDTTYTQLVKYQLPTNVHYCMYTIKSGFLNLKFSENNNGCQHPC